MALDFDRYSPTETARRSVERRQKRAAEAARAERDAILAEIDREFGKTDGPEPGDPMERWSDAVERCFGHRWPKKPDPRLTVETGED